MTGGTSMPSEPSVPGLEGVPAEPGLDIKDGEDCECQQLTAWLVKPTVKIDKRGLRQVVTVTIPYEWKLECDGASSFKDRCSGDLKFSVKAVGWQYVTKDGARLDAKLPPHGEEIIEGGKTKPKGAGPDIEVTCTGRPYCKGDTGKGQFQYRFVLNATDKLTGKVLVTITSKCGETTTARTAMIYVDSSLRGGVDEPYSDYDGDEKLNKHDKFPADPLASAMVPQDSRVIGVAAAPNEQPNNLGAQGNPNPLVGDNQDDPQKAKRKEIADDLREKGFKVGVGFGGGNGLVTARKYDSRGNLVEE